MPLEPKVHDLLLIKLIQKIVTSKTPAVDNSSSPLVSGASNKMDRFVPNHKNDGMQNVYYDFRKKRVRQAALGTKKKTQRICKSFGEVHQS